MKTIRLISIGITLSLISAFAFGQGRGQNGHGQQRFDDEKINAEKVAFITKTVDLTVKEAQVFWPIYNEHNDKMNALFQEEHKLYRDIKMNFDELTDAELTEKVDRMVEINKEKAELEVEYNEMYKEVLPIKKVALLYQADKEFRKHLLHKYKAPPEE
ncbi:MAG: hypothetical protein C0596_05935 [Marinilabiliales bacterium]|nr:MAG: hypothetical protein C0596_05935 [Marinilabiliales bacterium]